MQPTRHALLEEDFRHGPGRCMPARDAHNDNGGCAHPKGLFNNTAVFLYPAGFAVVVSCCRANAGLWEVMGATLFEALGGTVRRSRNSAAPLPQRLPTNCHEVGVRVRAAWGRSRVIYLCGKAVELMRKPRQCCQSRGCCSQATTITSTVRLSCRARFLVLEVDRLGAGGHSKMR